MKFGFVVARDLNQLVSAKAESDFGSYFLRNTCISDMLRLFFANKLVWHLRVVDGR